MKMRIETFALIAFTVLLAGCSGSGTGLTTGSLFGSSKEAAPNGIVETPSMRAAQVAAVSARAAKCGYNYDPVRLKSGFLASEGKAVPRMFRSSTVSTIQSGLKLQQRSQPMATIAVRTGHATSRVTLRATLLAITPFRRARRSMNGFWHRAPAPAKSSIQIL